MLSLLLVLFFGATGIALNHPKWTLGFSPSTEALEGTLPSEVLDAAGGPDLLAVSEHVRAEHDVQGIVTDYGADEEEGFISYRGPGYGADLFFDAQTGEYYLTVQRQGFVGVLNDLHKGRDTAIRGGGSSTLRGCSWWWWRSRVSCCSSSSRSGDAWRLSWPVPAWSS